MGTVFAEITLKNGGDIVRLQDGNIAEKDVRSMTVNAVVDTGAFTLVINESTCRELGLRIEASRNASVVGGSKLACKVTEPVRICWKDRDASCRAWVVPSGSDILLGAIPLEEMDLAVNLATRELVGVHGDEIVGMIK